LLDMSFSVRSMSCQRKVWFVCVSPYHC
jgi:hypothetical protein